MYHFIETHEIQTKILFPVYKIIKYSFLSLLLAACMWKEVDSEITMDDMIKTVIIRDKKLVFITCLCARAPEREREQDLRAIEKETGIIRVINSTYSRESCNLLTSHVRSSFSSISSRPFSTFLNIPVSNYNHRPYLSVCPV